MGIMTATGGAETVTLVVGAEDAGLRLDRFLSGRLTSLSRARLQALIRAGHVSGVRGTIWDGDFRVKPGDRLTVSLPPPAEAGALPEAIPLTVVYEDQDLIVIDKPAGLVVHPAAGHAKGTLVNALIAHCGATLSGIGGALRPGIVHRLDRDTSGLLVVAKTDAAHRGLAAQFAAHGADGRLERSYLALCWGVPVPSRGRIEGRIGRSTTNRRKMAVVSGQAGRAAVTRYQVVRSFPSGGAEAIASLLRLQLETGRTHQIRVHLAHIGHPLLGDPLYGAGFRSRARKLPNAAAEALAQLGRQALHAAALGFEHPLTGRKLRFESSLPRDMAALTERLNETFSPQAPGRRKK